MITIRSAIAAHLISVGWVRDLNARTSKYLVFSHKDQDFNFYLGASGAMRKGEKATDTIAMGSAFVANCEAKGRAILAGMSAIPKAALLDSLNKS